MPYTWDFSGLTAFAPALTLGLTTTLSLSMMAILCGTILGLLLSIAQTSDSRFLTALASAYTNIFFALPVLVLLVWLYYCVPLLLPLRLSATQTAILGLSLSLAAFVADILRAGIDAIPRGQAESARLLGLSDAQILRTILFPQAFRLMLPPLLGQYITCIKLSSLASVIGVYELLHTGNNIISHTYKPLETYTAIACLYFLLIFPLVTLMRRLESRTSLRFSFASRRQYNRGYSQWLRDA